MGGFFGLFDYAKPGPGVPKDAPPKPRIVVFFEIFIRKFWNLSKLNMMFFLFNIPALLAAMYLAQIGLQKVLTGKQLEDFVLCGLLAAFLVCIPVITVGPAQAGFTFILRNYAREEHAFIWWDFRDNAKKNFKEGIIISLVDLFVVFMVFLDINIYNVVTKSSFIASVASVLLFLAFTLYLMMHMYIYPILVTFKLGVKQIFRNAFIFALIYFLPNLAILIVCAALVFIPLIINPMIGIILFFFVTQSTIGLITNYFVYPRIKKHMMDKVQEAEQNESGNAEISADSAK